jgi:hypothetical protein
LCSLRNPTSARSRALERTLRRGAAALIGWWLLEDRSVEKVPEETVVTLLAWTAACMAIVVSLILIDLAFQGALFG